MEEARLATGRPDGSPAYRLISPDATIRVDLASTEWSNTHWVNSPRVTEIPTGRVVLDLWNTDWDATASFPRLRCVRLDLRRYGHGGGVAVEIDLAADAYRIVSESGRDDAQPAAPLAGVASGLEDASRRAAAATATAPGRSGARDLTRGAGPFAAWRSAVLIALAAAVAIAGATALSVQFGASRVPAALATIPRLQPSR